LNRAAALGDKKFQKMVRIAPENGTGINICGLDHIGQHIFRFFFPVILFFETAEHFLGKEASWKA
jgi:hypothetical protein